MKRSKYARSSRQEAGRFTLPFQFLMSSVRWPTFRSPTTTASSWPASSGIRSLHRIEEPVLLDLLGGVGLAGVHVGRDDGDDAVADLVVGLEPTAGAVEVVGAELDPMDVRALAARDRHARAALRGRRVVQDVPLVAEERLPGLRSTPHLLHREDVDIARGQPLAHARRNAAASRSR